MAKHYIRLGSDNSTIIYSYSDCFEEFKSGDILYKETEKRQFNLELKNALGFYCKKWSGSEIVDMSISEIDTTEVNRDKRINIKAAELAVTDKQIVRVIDDLVTILIQKGVMTLADLPKAVRDKIAERQAIREELSNL